MELNVWKAIPAPKSWGFAKIGTFGTWREANVVRSKIYKEGLAAKDNSIPLTYDNMGNLISEGWQKGV